MSRQTPGDRLADLDWPDLERQIWELGRAKTPVVVSPAECAELVALYSDDRKFRKRVRMGAKRLGEGDYGYFRDPLPPAVRRLRTALYGHLAPLANRMQEALSQPVRFPGRWRAFAELCRGKGQTAPTVALLHYTTGGFNCLHQDRYGEIQFPLQATLFLSRPGIDYGGGEFLLLEGRPRAQSRGEAIAMNQGEMLLFPSVLRPVQGKQRILRANMRHGLSTIAWGERYALGLIFPLAK